ncbi:ABC transporter ATP-binding protein [Oceanobacillus alkalisoli]|uniref:ABC transporter ATP-binding protein n=1 Tax=Oceanobacillus alkalisoli TaxID=2925113 RepID=UPI001EF05DF2|nr:ABC transporter ATP-binding protein [Oceanobacillus alkalisoli]MCF3943491.1 ABC transporter ATP-binding protein [Oceanobacillus alkalisoli]MCG5104079.1 ABC transporter ATP-binding protein [Oceanobacillus alkalisoli]
MTILKLAGISHHYFSKNGYTKALEDISFSLERGEFISILGPSGCGKSTILSIIARLLQHTSGDIFIHEVPIKESKEEIGYMLQQDYLFPWKTVLQNVLLGPKIQKREDEAIEDRANVLLQEVGLSNVKNQYPTELSGGMRQRAALVRTLMNNPEIFLLDEPFSSLDFQTKLKLEDLVATILNQYEKTTILVTHDIGEAIAMSDRIIMMEANPGRIVKIYDVPTELRAESPIVARKHDAFQPIFDTIWQELEKKEKSGEGI